MERMSPPRRALAALSIVVAATLAYLPALTGGFVFDDQPLIVGGAALNHGPLSRIWFGAAAPDYLPLTWTTFWIEWRVWGANPVGYHVVNVGLHAAAAILLWRVLLRLGVRGAWFGALLFAVHPAAVESVAWISERKNTLSAVLFFGSALVWLAADDDGRTRAAAPRLRIGAVALFAAALLAKASVVMLPLVLVGIEKVRRGRLERRDLVRTAPLFALSVAAAAVTIWFQRHNALSGEVLPARGLVERVGGAGWALVSYVERAFVPVRLGFVYAPWPVAPGSPWFWMPLAAVLAAAAFLWRWRSGPARPLALALAYHATMLVPVLGILDMAYLRVGPVSNHLQYLSVAGPAALAGWALAGLRERLPRAGVAAGAALVFALGVSTHARARAFESDASLWEAAVRDAPASAFARKQLAITLLQAGRNADAERALVAYAATTRDAAERHRALAVAAILSGRWQDAVEEARRAQAAAPDVRFLNDLARQLEKSGRPAEAAEVRDVGSVVAPRGDAR